MPKTFGIGVDIEDISRFRKHLSNKNFLDRIFTRKELKHCFSKKKPEQHLAARFAGKEAIVKSLSSLKDELDYRNIEILNKKNGAPAVKVTDNDFDKLIIMLSLSHCDDKAIAFAAVEANYENNQ